VTTTAQPDIAIACTGLRKVYPRARGPRAAGPLVAVDRIDLTIRRGECFGMLGPNGAGKTTTVEILEGLVAPTAGDVRVLGLTWARDAARLRGRVGVVLQETRLPDRLSVEECLELFASLYPSHPAVDGLLEDLGLGEKRAAHVSTLSGGQHQRLVIGCALVGDPEILFLDEPTTGLDPQSRRQLWALVHAFRASGKTVVLTTHSMEEAERLCDRVAVVDRGRVVCEGRPATLVANLGAAHVIEFRLDGGAMDDDAVRSLPGVASARAIDDGGTPGWALSVQRPHEALPALFALASHGDMKLAHLAMRTATLEDVFVSLTGRQLRA
jgi:ABC-2 type transport system ATP-binding protein